MLPFFVCLVVTAEFASQPPKLEQVVEYKRNSLTFSHQSVALCNTLWLSI